LDLDLNLGAERIHRLAKESGTTVNKMLVTDLKLSKSVVDNMLKGSVPSADKLAAIAHYLSTTTSYILGMSDDKEPATPKEQPVDDDVLELARKLKALSPRERKMILGAVEAAENQSESQ